MDPTGNSDQTPDLGASAPVAGTDSEYSPQQILQMYHAAAMNKDQASMQELDGMLRAAYAKQTANYDPTKNDPWYQKLAEGTGYGMERGAKWLGSHISDMDDNPLVSKQDLQEMDQNAQPLLKTGWGEAGNIVGQVAAMAPLGGVDGAILKGGEGLLAAGAARVAPWVAKVLRLSTRTGMAGGEGALQSAATADPNEQGGQAEAGGVLSAALSALGHGGGAVVRGLVDKSPTAQLLIDKAKQEGQKLFIPISQAGTGVAKAVYKHVLPYALGVEHRLKGQAGEAADTMRNVIAEQSMPLEADGTSRMKAPLQDTPENTAAAMRSELADRQQQTIGSRQFTVPFNFRDEVVHSLQQAHPDIPMEIAGNIADKVTGQLNRYMEGGGQDLFPGISHEVDEDTGHHTFTSKNGFTEGQEDGRYLLVKNSQTAKDARKAGEGTSRLEAAAQEAGRRGLMLGSDKTVSADEAGVYQNLQKLGYNVKTNPHTINEATDGLISKNPRKPVFEVTPKNAGDTSNGQISGTNLLRAREAAGRDLDSAMGRNEFNVPEWRNTALGSFDNVVDNAIHEHEGMLANPGQMKPKDVQAAQEFLRDMQNYKRLRDAAPEYEPVLEASEASKNTPNRGAYNFKDLASRTNPGTNVRETAQQAHEVLDQNPGSVNPAGRHALNEGLLGFGVLGHMLGRPEGNDLIAGGLGAIGVGNALATRRAQNFLYGDLASQKALANWLRNNPQAAYSTGMGLRSAVNAARQ